MNADFVQLRDQIPNIVANASFNGHNMTSTTSTGARVSALGDTNGLNNIDVAPANLNLGGQVGLSTTSDVSTTATAATALTQINTSIDNVGRVLATWGAGSKRLTMHRQFVTKLQDAITNGKSELVDADIERESAKLQAYQVKVQLGTQALSIANAAPQIALALFRN